MREETVSLCVLPDRGEDVQELAQRLIAEIAMWCGDLCPADHRCQVRSEIESVSEVGPLNIGRHSIHITVPAESSWRLNYSFGGDSPRRSVTVTIFQSLKCIDLHICRRVEDTADARMPLVGRIKKRFATNAGGTASSPAPGSLADIAVPSHGIGARVPAGNPEAHAALIMSPVESSSQTPDTHMPDLTLAAHPSSDPAFSVSSEIARENAGQYLGDAVEGRKQARIRNGKSNEDDAVLDERARRKSLKSGAATATRKVLCVSATGKASVLDVIQRTGVERAGLDMTFEVWLQPDGKNSSFVSELRARSRAYDAVIYAWDGLRHVKSEDKRGSAKWFQSRNARGAVDKFNRWVNGS